MEKEKQNNDTYRKLSTFEKQVISEAIEKLFAVHYLNMGYYFMESDIDIFYYIVNTNKINNKPKLPMAQDLDYCYMIVQNILYIVRMMRYEQRMLSNYILRCNIKIKDLYFKVKDANTKNKEELDQDLLKLVGLFADIEAFKQYLAIVLKTLNVDKTLYKDVVIKSQLNDKKYKKYIDYTLIEYLNDNVFFDDIYEKLKEIQTFLSKDNNKVYYEIIKRLVKNKVNDTDISIKTLLGTFKTFSKNTLKEASKMQKELSQNGNNTDRKTFEKNLLFRSDTDLLAVSLQYCDTITDFYRNQILLRGFENE